MKLPHRKLLTSVSISGLVVTGAWQLAAAGRLAIKEKHPVFSHPTNITNLYLPLSNLHSDLLTGREEGQAVRIERTMKSGTRSFTFNGQKVAARIMQDRESLNGNLKEVTLDYFAQADDGTVYYMGEDVNVYRDGKVIGHGGGWLTGQHGAPPGVLMPGHPKKGVRFHSENVPGIAEEADEIVFMDETVIVPAGTFHHCIKVKETVPGEEPEYKYYAPRVGVVREVPHGGDEKLISHK